MFDSGISLESLIDNFENEVDIALSIPKLKYVEWANALEQFLYTEIIKEQGKISVDLEKNPSVAVGDTSPDMGGLGEALENGAMWASAPTVEVEALENSAEEGKIRFEDIYTVFADSTQLIKTNLTSGNIFPDTYFKNDGKLAYNTAKPPRYLNIIYFVKPVLHKVESGEATGNIMLPVEFVSLMEAKLRGEAYKLANENTYAANWLNEYNALLEQFKLWMAGKQAEFGM